MLERVLSADAPAPIGPYNQPIRAGGFLFCSGQIPLDAASGDLEQGDIGLQTRKVLENLRAVLAAGGTTFARVVKTTIYLIDMNDFTSVNTVYGEYFGDVPPARSTVAVVALPRGARVEIEAIALL